MCVQRMASTAAWQWGRVGWSWTGGVRSCACRTRWRARRQPRLQRSRSTARRPHGAPSPSPASVWLRTSQVGELCGGGSCCWRAIFRVTQRGHIGHRRPALAGRLVRRTRSGDTLSSASSGKIKHVEPYLRIASPCLFLSAAPTDQASLLQREQLMEGESPMRDDHEQLQKKMEKHEHNKKLAAEHNDEINDEIETKTLEEKSDTIVQAAATAGSIAHLRISRAREPTIFASPPPSDLSLRLVSIGSQPFLMHFGATRVPRPGSRQNRAYSSVWRACFACSSHPAAGAHTHPRTTPFRRGAVSRVERRQLDSAQSRIRRAQVWQVWRVAPEQARGARAHQAGA